MSEKRLSAGKLLDHKGRLLERGYAAQLVRAYERKAVKGGALRIKEWDYYLVTNDRFGLALTIADNSYMGLISCSFLDFENGTEKTVSPMFWLPLGKTRFPASSKTGDVQKRVGKDAVSFTHEAGGRRLRADFADFDGAPLTADVLLTDEPRDTMVIATPFAGKETAFYYNQKIVAMRAQGSVTHKGKTYAFDPKDSFGLLDWGRGVWTYENTWFWGAGQGDSQGRTVGFNLGYGFGDTSAASENMLFIDGVMHKFEHVDFGIPAKPDGTDDFLAPWRFSSRDGRFEGVFTPVLDRASCTKAGPILSDQHQVFGHFDGTLVLDGGERLALSHFLMMAEKVHNKW